MGSGIAQVAATNGDDVILRDLDDGLLDDAFETIRQSLDRIVDAGKLTESEAGKVVESIDGTTVLGDLADTDVVEAAPEDMEVKREIFADLDDIVPDDVVLATNTSTLSITSIASVTDRPEFVVGLHFMNPVPVMDGVELVVGEKTADDVVQFGHDLAADLEKETWESEDKPGFVTNRILIPWINEGIRAYDEGVATKEDV
ncbi:MAG: 3-hydroxyacyl-CoA dehydrogenase family protein, partial [Halanaeroarchaeum sp.]